MASKTSGLADRGAGAAAARPARAETRAALVNMLIMVGDEIDVGVGVIV